MFRSPRTQSGRSAIVAVTLNSAIHFYRSVFTGQSCKIKIAFTPFHAVAREGKGYCVAERRFFNECVLHNMATTVTHPVP